MAAWPGTLPQKPLIDGYSETVPNTLIRTEMDAGPAKVRRRFTAGVRTFSMKVILTAAQAATLDTFYVTTTNGGADAWDWENPRTETAAIFRFVSEPVYTPISGTHYTAQLQLEELP